SFLAIDTSNGADSGQRLALSDDGRDAYLIVLTEVNASGVHWMEPRDLALEDAKRGLVMRSAHGSVRIVTRDGFVGTLYRSELSFRDSEADLLRLWLSPPRANGASKR